MSHKVQTVVKLLALRCAQTDIYGTRIDTHATQTDTHATQMDTYDLMSDKYIISAPKSMTFPAKMATILKEPGDVFYQVNVLNICMTSHIY